MNVSMQNVDKVSALLTVNIEKADYQEKVEKVLKKYRQQANIPGFRKGMVPMSLIKKQFGKSVTAEEVDRLMQEKVNEYIRENKVNMLGMPLPNEEKMQPIDFDTQENFEFVFDIALAPEFKAELTEKDAIDFYTIAVSDEMVNSQVEMYAQRASKYDKVDSYQDRDMVKGLLAELDAEGNGHTVGHGAGHGKRLQNTDGCRRGLDQSCKQRAHDHTDSGIVELDHQAAELRHIGQRADRIGHEAHAVHKNSKAHKDIAQRLVALLLGEHGHEHADDRQNG